MTAASYLKMETVYHLIAEGNRPVIELIERNCVKERTHKTMLAQLLESEPNYDPQIAPLELLAEVIECLPVIKSQEVLSSFQTLLAQKIHQKAMEELKIAKLNCPSIYCDLDEEALAAELELKEANIKLAYFKIMDLYHKIAALSRFKTEEASSDLKPLVAQSVELINSYRSEYRELEVFRKSEWVVQSKKRL